MKKRKMRRLLQSVMRERSDALEIMRAPDHEPIDSAASRLMISLQDAWKVQADLSHEMTAIGRERDIAVLRMADAHQRFQTLSRIHEVLRSQKLVNAEEPADDERMSAVADHLDRARREAHATGELLRDIHVPGGEKLFDALLRLATHLEDAGHALAAKGRKP